MRHVRLSFGGRCRGGVCDINNKEGIVLLTERSISIQERVVLLMAELDETDGVLRSV
jgi:hypothetical protein